jgi:hypothetical protein
VTPPPAGLKLMLFHRRAEGLTPQAWDAFWRGEHLARLLDLVGATRVVQDVPRRGTIVPPLDGIDEVYFEDESAARTVPEALLAEAREHNTPQWPRGMVAWERVAVPRTDGANAVRRMAAVCRNPDLAPDVFEYEWEVVHPPFVGALIGMRGYVQSVPVAAIPGLAAPDGASTLWWDSVEVCEAAYADRGPSGQAHEAHMARIFARGLRTGTYCDPSESLTN